MKVVYNGNEIEINTERENGYEEYNFVKAINDYDFDDTIVISTKDNTSGQEEADEE